MNNKKTSIDGFIPRRPGSQMGERHTIGEVSAAPARKELRSEEDMFRTDAELGKVNAKRSILRDDINESLQEIDATSPLTNARLSRREKRRLRKERKRLRRENRTRGQIVRRRILKTLVWLLILGAVAVGGFFAYKTFLATGSVLNGGFLGLVQHEPLKEDVNGRSNFLILGTSEDDPGHDASYLTDSIMILSVNQKEKNAYMFSIPRDLYVNYNMACQSGYRGKINVYFSCVSDGEDSSAEQERLAKTQAFIGDIIGMDIQYGVHVNYTVMRDVVNAIGGSITVTIESRDPRGLMDGNFDWKCGASYAQRLKNCPPNGHFIDYPNGPVTIDAEHALYLAQARGDTDVSYGLEQSNFDRERNQQKILVAIRDKALSAGTLTNIGAITGLIDALGHNLRTNVQTKEVRTLMELASEIKAENIQSIDLYTPEAPIFTTGPIEGAGSSVYPRAGLYNYSELRTYLQKQVSSSAVVKEEPHVMVLNGSDTPGVAQTVADKLEGLGYIIDLVGNAPQGTYPALSIYQRTTDKTASIKKLETLYNVTSTTATPPVSVMGETDLVVIIGDASVVE